MASGFPAGRDNCSRPLSSGPGTCLLPPGPVVTKGRRRIAHEVELELARELASIGGEIALRYYRRDPETTRKPDGTWVTEADRAVEARIRTRIAEAFPSHNVLGEEEGITRAGGGPPSPDAPLWVIDPIDGTNNFIAGIPIWGVLVALREGEQSVVGVCHLPTLGETYDAATGAGARMNGETIRVDGARSLDEATLVVAGDHRFYERGLLEPWSELVRRSWRVRGFGDCWGHMLVARGATHAMLEPELSIWDFAALEPIVTEAGGRITGFDGRPVSHGGSCISSNGWLHDEIVGVLQG